MTWPEPGLVVATASRDLWSGGRSGRPQGPVAHGLRLAGDGAEVQRDARREPGPAEGSGWEAEGGGS